MEQTVYTNYWQNRLSDVRKEHGSYENEEEAINGIKAWWELHKENYPHAEYKRTNSGALEIIYNDENHFYRIEKREINGTLPSRKFKSRKPGEIDALRSKHSLHEEAYLFEELAEPYRDRLVQAMADSDKLRNHVFDAEGRPIRKLRTT